VDEATALGAAVVGGVGAGIFDDFEIAGRLSQRGTPQAPDPGRQDHYRRAYPLFLEAYTRLEPWFDKL
jgi:xylulokinase